MARLRGEVLRLRIRMAGGRCGTFLWVGRGLVLKYPPHRGLVIGDFVRLGEYLVIDVPPPGRLEIGSHTTFSMGVVLAASMQLTVGRDVLVGEYASLRDADHGMALGLPMYAQPMQASPVLIGDDVWIGRGACILKGASLGGGWVVGGNSVVTRAVPVLGVAAGAPARVVRTRGAELA